VTSLVAVLKQVLLGTPLNRFRVAAETIARIHRFLCSLFRVQRKGLEPINRDRSSIEEELALAFRFSLERRE
jgi:hypothetical protein